MRVTPFPKNGLLDPDDKRELDAVDPNYRRLIEGAIADENKKILALDPRRATLARVVHPDRRNDQEANTKVRKFGNVLVFRQEKAREPLSEAYMSNSIRSIGLDERKLKFRGAEVALSPCHVNAMKVVLHLPFRVLAKWDKSFCPLEKTVAQLSTLIGLKYRMSHEDAKALLAEIGGVRFLVRKGSEFIVIPATAISKLDLASGVVRLKLNPELAPYLLDLERDFRKIHECLFKLPTSRAISLYLHLRTFIGTRRSRSVPLKDLRRILQVSNKLLWYDLHKGALDPVVQAVNKNTELVVSYDLERQGGRGQDRARITAVKFKVAERPNTKSKLTFKPLSAQG